MSPEFMELHSQYIDKFGDGFNTVVMSDDEEKALIPLMRKAIDANEKIKHKILYQLNVVILWLAAWRLVLGSWRLGACSSWPLIMIRGPKRSQLLLMIFKSSAMLES